MNWKNAYKSLVAVRRWLNVMIDYARAKAYPQTGGRRTRAVAAPTTESES